MSQKTNPNPTPRKTRSLLPSFASRSKAPQDSSKGPGSGGVGSTSQDNLLVETAVSILSTDSSVEGDFTLSASARIHGKVKGRVLGTPGSYLVIAESALIEGTVSGDSIVIDGYVRGDVEATGKITISSSGRVIGNIKAPALEINFGGTFEGTSTMPTVSGTPAGATT